MNAFPRKLPPSEGPPEIVQFVPRLMPLLLAGEHAALDVLRRQWGVAEIGEIELSGVGFFAALDVPRDAPRIEPPNVTGGDARIVVEGIEHGAGCVLFVHDGYLKLLEGHTYGTERWGPEARVLDVVDASPLPV